MYLSFFIYARFGMSITIEHRWGGRPELMGAEAPKSSHWEDGFFAFFIGRQIARSSLRVRPQKQELWVRPSPSMLVSVQQLLLLRSTTTRTKAFIQEPLPAAATVSLTCWSHKFFHISIYIIYLIKCMHISFLFCYPILLASSLMAFTMMLTANENLFLCIGILTPSSSSNISSWMPTISMSCPVYSSKVL